VLPVSSFELWWTQQSVGCDGEWLQGRMGQDKCRNTSMYECIQPATAVTGCYIAFITV